VDDVASLGFAGLCGGVSGGLAEMFHRGVSDAASAVESRVIDVEPYLGDLGERPSLWRSDLADAYVAGVLAVWFDSHAQDRAYPSDVNTLRQAALSGNERYFGVQRASRFADANLFHHGYFGRTSLDGGVRRARWFSDADFIDVARQLYGLASRWCPEGNRRELFESLADTLPGYVVVLRVARLTHFGNGLLKTR
jgi:hypothetical protein